MYFSGLNKIFLQIAVLLFEKVIVTVMYNPSKKPLFPVEKRVEQIKECTQHLSKVEVDSYTGLTVDYAKLHNAQVLLRGLRVLSDFEKELQMAHTNKTLAKEVQTVFLATSKEYSFLSSSTVKEIARFGGSISHLVPENVAQDLRDHHSRNMTKVIHSS